MYLVHRIHVQSTRYLVWVSICAGGEMVTWVVSCLCLYSYSVCVMVWGKKWLFWAIDFRYCCYVLPMHFLWKGQEGRRVDSNPELRLCYVSTMITSWARKLALTFGSDFRFKWLWLWWSSNIMSISGVFRYKNMGKKWLVFMSKSDLCFGTRQKWLPELFHVYLVCFLVWEKKAINSRVVSCLYCVLVLLIEEQKKLLRNYFFKYSYDVYVSVLCFGVRNKMVNWVISCLHLVHKV